MELRRLVVDYEFPGRRVRAVDHVDLEIHAGEIFGLAGESGCGKSTTGNAILQILREPAHVSGGEILFRGENLLAKSREELRRFRWRNVSMVFQSAMNSLNPVMRVGDQFVDMMQAHERISKRSALERAGELLEMVGIDRSACARIRTSSPAACGSAWSSRWRSRSSPELVIMDEPTTALDVVVQREILQQIEALKRELDFAVLFITHDLSLLLEFADRIGIMYAGEIVETAPAARALPRAEASVHAGADELVPAAHRPDRADDRHPRHAARPLRPAERLPLPSALPALRPEDEPLYARQVRGAAAPEGGRAGPLRRLPPRRGRTVSTALDVQRLTKHFAAGGARLFARRAKLHAVDDVSFTLGPGTITALVGESGSGKSTVARILARLHDPTSGAVFFEGADATRATSEDVLRYRSQVQMIFQDPFGSLNPVKTIAHHIERPLKIHGIVPTEAVAERVHELL